MPRIVIDPDSRSLAEHPALVRGARRRARFPAGCVTTVADEASARVRADTSRNLHAAIVYGPSTSSEGLQVYYLVRWLD